MIANISQKVASLADNVINIGLPGEISDQSFLVFQLQLPRPPVNFVNVSTRAWKSFDEDSFRTELRASNLCNPAEYDGASVDDLQEMYDTTLRTLLDKHAPCQTARRRHQPTTPWFDADCAAAKRRTRAFEQRYRRTRLVSDRLAWTTEAQKKHQLYGRKQSEFWERKITDSRAIQRSYGDIWSLFFDRRKTSLQILRISLLRPSRTLSRRSWRAYVHRLRRPHPRFSTNRHASPVSTSSRSSIPPWYDASSAVQQANPANSTQFHLGSSKSSQTNFHHSLLHSSMHRWAATLFRQLRKPLPSLQFLRRRLSIRTISATIASFQTWRSYQSF